MVYLPSIYFIPIVVHIYYFVNRTCTSGYGRNNFRIFSTLNKIIHVNLPADCPCRFFFFLDLSFFKLFFFFSEGLKFFFFCKKSNKKKKEMKKKISTFQSENIYKDHGIFQSVYFFFLFIYL